jgi:1-acyl-sn-glycerol-3-phosphate acyltransferase
MGYLKAVALFGALLFFGSCSMILSLFRWGDTRLNRTFLQPFGKAAFWIVGIQYEVLHLERTLKVRPSILVGNHQSGLDLAVMGSICPDSTVIVGKKEIQYIPIFGWFFKAAGNLLIDRAKTKDAKAQMDEIRNTMTEKNLNMAIFPEGTRNRHSAGNDGLLPFKKGAFFLAVSTGFPIIPVVSSSLKGKGVWENFDLAGGRVIVSVLEPIETKNVKPEAMEEFKEHVRGLMIQEYKRINLLLAVDEAKARA